MPSGLQLEGAKPDATEINITPTILILLNNDVDGMLNVEWPKSSSTLGLIPTDLLLVPGCLTTGRCCSQQCITDYRWFYCRTATTPSRGVRSNYRASLTLYPGHASGGGVAAQSRLESHSKWDACPGTVHHHIACRTVRPAGGKRERGRADGIVVVAVDNSRHFPVGVPVRHRLASWRRADRYAAMLLFPGAEAPSLNSFPRIYDLGICGGGFLSPQLICASLAP